MSLNYLKYRLQIKGSDSNCVINQEILLVQCNRNIHDCNITGSEA